MLSQYKTGEYWDRHGIGKPADSLFSASALRRAEQTESGRDRLPWLTVRDATGHLPAPSAEAPNVRLRHTYQPGARIYPGHTGSALDAPSKTLKAGTHGVPGGENMLLDDQGIPRYYTVREAARIQTFPDDYTFSGPWGEALRQTGNAVPVSLACIIGKSLQQVFGGYSL